MVIYIATVMKICECVQCIVMIFIKCSEWRSQLVLGIVNICDSRKQTFVMICCKHLWQSQRPLFWWSFSSRAVVVVVVVVIFHGWLIWTIHQATNKPLWKHVFSKNWPSDVFATCSFSSQRIRPSSTLDTRWHVPCGEEPCQNGSIGAAFVLKWETHITQEYNCSWPSLATERDNWWRTNTNCLTVVICCDERVLFTLNNFRLWQELESWIWVWPNQSFAKRKLEVLR